MIRISGPGQLTHRPQRWFTSPSPFSDHEYNFAEILTWCRAWLVLAAVVPPAGVVFSENLQLSPGCVALNTIHYRTLKLIQVMMVLLFLLLEVGSIV